LLFICGGLLGSGIFGISALPLIDSSTIFYIGIVARAIYGVGVSGTNIVIVAYIQDLYPEKAEFYIALRLAFQYLGMTLGPILGSVLYEDIGFT